MNLQDALTKIGLVKPDDERVRSIIDRKTEVRLYWPRQTSISGEDIDTVCRKIESLGNNVGIRYIRAIASLEGCRWIVIKCVDIPTAVRVFDWACQEGWSETHATKITGPGINGKKRHYLIF